MRVLLANGASVNAKDKYNNTPLHRAANVVVAEDAQGPINVLLESVKSRIVRETLIDAKNSALETAFHIAVQMRNAGGALYLIRNGCDVFAEDENGKMAAEYANDALYKILKPVVQERLEKEKVNCQ